MGIRAFVGVVLLLVIPHAVAVAAPEDVYGLWRTSDQQAAVELYPCGPDLCGRLVWYVEKRTGADAGLDSKNPDEAQRARRLCGLLMIGNFRRRDGGWTGGWLYDPESGNTYSGTITPEGPDHLSLRGYIGIPLLGRTDHWSRAPDSQQRCR
ncbi:DUF2147 domain-containing protein [Azospirillum canadense]|uniref:DUF2147 domain-containing protein n=1 Tax=Azospirillum canadense TaxID=403962 RepID=UPI002226B831|nr:DUF2147 domain-containing protein [Azospirillum canadense]MCW2237024.1 uncharacterized protein (DUF2147 family) [Azospirillum canadense]